MVARSTDAATRSKCTHDIHASICSINLKIINTRIWSGEKHTIAQRYIEHLLGMHTSTRVRCSWYESVCDTSNGPSVTNRCVASRVRIVLSLKGSVKVEVQV
jgi:hypothetical protein